MASANIGEVARRAGVSKATVSRFLNGRNIRPAARDRVVAVIDRLGYRPNRLAQGLKSNRSTTIGLVVPDISNPFFPEVVKGAEAAARAAGFHVILANSGEDPELEWQQLQTLRTLQVDGFLLAPAPEAAASGARRERLGGLGVPVVFVDRAPGFAADLVCVDNARVAEEAVRHLCRLGHRRIAFVTVDQPISVHAARAQGYRRALREAGLAPDAALVARCAPTVADAAAATVTLLEQTPRPTAIFASGNRLAMGAVSAVTARGLACPEDVSVVGFDDFEWEGIFRPRLTTVAQPGLLLGERAAQLLIGRITGARKGPPERVVLGAQLVVRESCGVYARRGG
jgi:LacI family transcriptional regulator